MYVTLHSKTLLTILAYLYFCMEKSLGIKGGGGEEKRGGASVELADLWVFQVYII